jgi:hypothetical protein
MKKRTLVANQFMKLAEINSNYFKSLKITIFFNQVPVRETNQRPLSF